MKKNYLDFWRKGLTLGGMLMFTAFSTFAYEVKVEAEDAFEERKNLARKAGEEAGTKLLVPMFIMLAIVMAIMVVPAFFSIQI